MTAASSRSFWAGMSQAFLWALLLSVGVVVVYPLLWMALGGFKSNSQIFEQPFALPLQWSFANYLSAWQGVQGYMVSSLLITVVSTVTTVFISAWAAFGLTRTPMPAKPLVTAIVLGGMMLSPTVALVPLVRMLQSLGLYDTHWALIILYTAFRVPFTTFLIRAYMLDLPRDLDEAAMMDGANPGQIFRRIILPLCRPIIMSCIVLHILFAWNEYLLAATLTNFNARTLTTGLSEYVTTTGTNWGIMAAISVFTLIPALIVFALLQRHIVAGLTFGAVKG